MYLYKCASSLSRVDNITAKTIGEDPLRRFSADRNSVNLSTAHSQQAGYFSWQGVSNFFSRWMTNGESTSTPSKKLVEEKGNLDSVKEPKQQALQEPCVPMEETMEYKVTSYDTLPKIALKFDVTPSELSRLNKLTIRTLYPGQVLRVPCPKPATSCSECSEAWKQQDRSPKAMTIERSLDMSKIGVAKRVSFEDIDEDVFETFIKIKSKYITDGQGALAETTPTSKTT